MKGIHYIYSHFDQSFLLNLEIQYYFLQYNEPFLPELV